MTSAAYIGVDRAAHRSVRRRISMPSPVPAMPQPVAVGDGDNAIDPRQAASSGPP